MARSNINRKNRDRQGGHAVSMLTTEVYKEHDGLIDLTPEQRSEFKKKGKTVARRRRLSLISEGLTEMETDFYDQQELNMFGKDSYDMADERHEFEEFQAGYPEDQYDGYLDDLFFEETFDPVVRDEDYDNLTDEDHRHISGADYDDYRGDVFAEPEYDRRYPIERMTHQPEQRGTAKTLGQILREYLGEN